MTNFFIFSDVDIIQQIKLSCQIPDIIEAIATRKIIADSADKAGIKIEKGELQQSADNIRLNKKLIKSEDTWIWLQKHYLSLDEFKELARINLLSEKLANYLFAKQVEPFFFEHQLDYAASVTYEVVLDDEDLAWKLFYALQENKISFPEIARQYIQDPELRRVGGYCGIQHRSNFRPEIAAYVFAAHPPQILKPMITQEGIYLIWVEEIIQPQLNEPLRCKILGDLFSAWLKQQLEEVKILVQLEQ
ncbi:peptidylprolyl isomerase [Komarekiella sp. 'clone 1']|uniref:peptidylprolyl isomerase n=1 Tax=Komarekiella delphini-convector SJRDD-AB1 TaxID=2593771 RepID=A0AA40VR65_9NOST|nr:peptidylprolyl isomerase [Komarekiella delphini-convector]MBD6615946.1 peptidylprolyl isomerase [Komarekiella delphini-convector SJRDD-AB1]